ncbi:hypothetical protein LAZ67_8004021, partial [Cordylochernes scorpioides]
MHETKGRHKFEPRYGGPYEVLRRAGDTVYLLKNLETGNLDKYHIDRLKQYHIPIRIFPTEEEETSDGNSSQGSSDEDHWIHLTGPAYLPNRSVNVVVPQGVTTRANSEVMRRGEVDRKEGSNESSTPRGKDGVERTYHKEGLLLKAKEESGRVVYIPMNVLVERMHETKGRHKFEPRYGGPYEVLRRAGDTVYLLKNLETGNLDKYHIDRLKQYHIPIRIFPTEEEETSDGNSSQGSSDEDHWIHLTGPAYLPNRSVNVVVPQGVTTRANSEVMRRGEVDRKEGSNESSTPRGKDGVERTYHKEGLLLKAKEESGRVVYIPMN